MKTPYDDIPGLAKLPDEEKKKTIVLAATAALKTPLHLGFLLLQIVGFVCLLIWLPRGVMHLPLIFAYVFSTYLLLKRYRTRQIRQRICESLGTKAGG